MLDKFVNWYRTYDSEITWWLIGWLSWGFLDALGRGQWILALVDLVLIVINYKLWKDRG